MSVAIPLGEMTIPDKFLALEEIWDDLCRTAKEIPAPAWHGDVLRARDMRVQEGTSRYGDWSEAKSRIRKCVK